MQYHSSKKFNVKSGGLMESFSVYFDLMTLFLYLHVKLYDGNRYQHTKYHKRESPLFDLLRFLF